MTDRSNSLSLLRPVLWSALLLLAIEVGLEVRAYGRGYETMLFGQRDAVPTKQGRSKIDQWGPTEEFPFRSVVVEPVKQPELLRIWIASASQAEDQRLPPDVVFPAVLERDLQERGIRAQVLNAGHAGRAIASSQEDLKRLAGIWQPDIVVLYHMEAGTPVAEESGGTVPALEDQEIAQANVPRTGQVNRSALDRFVEQLTLYTLLRTNFTSRLVAEKQLPDRVSEEVIDEFATSVDSFVRQVEAIGARPVLCTIAISHEVQDLSEMPTEFRLVRLRFDSSVSVAGWVDSVATINDRLFVYAQQNDLPLVTLAEDVGGQPKYFRDPVHFTRAGHAAVARVLADQLTEQLAFEDLTARQ